MGQGDSHGSAVLCGTSRSTRPGAEGTNLPVAFLLPWVSPSLLGHIPVPKQRGGAFPSETQTCLSENPGAEAGLGTADPGVFGLSLLLNTLPVVFVHPLVALLLSSVGDLKDP